MSSDASLSVALVIPVFNRKEMTLRCLRHLDATGVFSWAHVIVVDDGSTDGTADALSAEFPQTEILKGDGNLWWGGGINLGTRAALAKGAGHVFWLNDDCFPVAGALKKLLSSSIEHRAVTTASVRVIETGSFGLGGWKKTRSGVSLAIPEGDNLEPCDTFSGNCACIPKEVFEAIGLVDVASFPHAGGDADFGFRVGQAGFPVLAVGGAICDLSDPPLKNRRSWLFGDITVPELWRMCFHRHTGSLALAAWRLRWKHWGWMGLLVCTLQFLRLIRATVIRLLVPQQLLRKCLGRFSHTHRVHTEYDEWLKRNGSAEASTRNKVPEGVTCGVLSTEK